MAKELTIFQIATLKNASVEELQRKHKELFGGQEATSNNKVYLIRRISYRLQELEYGNLSEKSQNRLNDLIKLYNPINNKAMRPKISMETDARRKNIGRDSRIPIPGSVIIKEHRGKKIEVRVLENGFEYNGEIYKTLTAIAKEITGAHWNGYLFFNL
jgi:Protein of unknown function (DUF2924)